MKYYFSSDLHLGHFNIIRYAGRPFKSLDDMNEALVSRWNNRVHADDQVIHVGDFCFRNSPGGKKGEGTPHKASHWQDMLNGNIIFIAGNHDKNNSVKTIIQKLVIKYGPHYVNVVHNPEHYDPNFAINFVGHVHEKWKHRRIYVPYEDRYTDLINVGVDVNDFEPKTFEELYSGYKKWSKNVKKEEIREG